MKTEPKKEIKKKVVKKTKPDYIYDGNINCPSCDSESTEINKGDLKCLNCGYIIKGIVIVGIVGIFLTIFL